MKKVLLYFSLFFLSHGYAQQDTIKDTAAVHHKAPKVYIDCQAGCDMQYIRAHMPYLNFVMDMRLSDAYILITGVANGGGGRQHTLFVTDEHTNKNDTLQLSIPPNVSEAMYRDLLLKKIKQALLPFIAATLSEYVNFDIPMPEEKKENSKPKDKWNSWTGLLSIDGSGGGQSYSLNYGANGRFSMSRITPKNKFDATYRMNYSYTQFDYGEGKITGFRKGFAATTLEAFSISEHLTVGWFGSYVSDSRFNWKTNVSFFPAVEFNLFPYSKATRKAFRVIYRAGVRYQEYFSETVLNTNNMLLFPHSLVIDYTQIEKWGTITLDVGGWHYFNNTESYSLTVTPSIQLNLFKGFRWGIFGTYSFVNDQFYLKKSAAVGSQVLLGQTQLKTSFTFFTGTGISYSFGSIYNNTVNVRFDMDRSFW
jgi:hypothetical protein